MFQPGVLLLFLDILLKTNKVASYPKVLLDKNKQKTVNHRKKILN